jgi:hypothetical protein
VAGTAANHPRRECATYLGAEAGSVVAAGVIHGSPRRYQTRVFFLISQGLVAPGAATNHPRRDRATDHGAEVVGMVMAGVIRECPYLIFI